jgi:DNA-binding MurR/RpiR family transcriptional regulator
MKESTLPAESFPFRADDKVREMKANLHEEIKKSMGNFSRTQKRLANFLLDNWSEIPLLSIEAIAKKSGVSMASITRLTRKLSCKGFYDFKIQIKREHMHDIVNPVERFFSIKSDLSGKKSLIKAARQDVKNINRLLAGVNEETFLKLVECIEKARRVFTYGVGISSIFSNLAAYTFNQIQKETHSLDEGHTPVEEKILALTPEDIIIFSSFFPYSKCTVDFARLAHRRGLKIVTFSDNEFSPLSEITFLLLKIPRENILFTTSISAMAVLLNAVATEIALKKKDVLAHSLKDFDRILRTFYV